MSVLGVIRRYPIRSYFILTFAISWSGFVLAVGPDGFPGKPEQFDALLPSVALAMLVGPSAAGLLMTGLVSGHAGLRELLSRLLKWRVNARWYALAILPAPVLTAGVLFAFSMTSPIFTADNKISILIGGALAGLSTVLEEIGWTGFAAPRLLRRHGILVTGLIIGIPWALWHFLQIFWVSATYSGGIALPLFVALYVLSGIAGLTAYRVLLVWMHVRTNSLLLVTLMHASLSACNVFYFRPTAFGASFLAYGFLLAAATWLVVALVAAMNGRGLGQQPQRISNAEDNKILDAPSANR